MLRLVRLLLTITVLSLASFAAAQTSTPPASKPQPGKPLPPPMNPADQSGPDFGPASVAKLARQALEAGKVEDAIALADRVLVRLPGRADVAQVKIEALFAAHKPDDALAVYETFAKANQGKDDPAILAVMGRAVLKQIADTPNDLAAPAALGALARAGDKPARQKLVTMSQSTTDASSAALATEVLARLGDPKAIDALVKLASSESPNRSAGALKTLGELRERRAAPVVVAALASPNVLVKLMAINAAGRLKAVDAKPALEKTLKDSPYALRLQAAGALFALGDKAGLEPLQQALASEYPDARLGAAASLAEAGDRSWRASITPILTNQDGLLRFKAAELLLATDHAAAIDVLDKGATDPNPTIRAEVARIVADDPRADLALVRRFLKDQSAWARLYAASRLTRPS